ncbi:MAG: signal transduction histidine kinase [bacterium]|jgi:signal transduction histidine kinase
MVTIFRHSKVVSLAIIVIIISFLVGTISILAIYNNAKQQLYNRLQDIVNLEKAGIEARMGLPDTNENDIIKFIEQIRKKTNSIGNEYEILLARSINDSIQFIFSDKSLNNYPKFSKKNPIATLMQNGLNRESGYLKQKDYNGVKVFAAYTFVEELNWGIVAKIPTSDFNSPYIKTFIWIGISFFGIISFFTYLFLRITNPEIDRVETKLELAKEKIVVQGEEKTYLIDELTIVKKEKVSRVKALQVAKEKIVVQGQEKINLIDELIIVKKEKVSRVKALQVAKEKIVVQGQEKTDLIDELTIVKKEKVSRVKALEVAKEKIVVQGQEKASLVDELVIANKELAFQNEEKAKRANELEFKIKHRTKELEESLGREKELGVLKTNFVSMASHEFRTPLTAISATTDIILRYYNELSQDGINIRLEKIKKEVLDMTVMLEDILIIGKSNSQKLEYKPSLINLTDTIKNIVSEYQLSDPQNRSISYALSSSDIMVVADKKWINHIVINLLSNAIKYSEDDTPIEISIKEEQTVVYFSFTDYGIGIMKKDIEKLFEPFHRGENVGNVTGTGLGLSVLEKAINLHKGKIEIESEIGKGSRFKVILPSTKNNI